MVATTVGPYVAYGEPLVAACAEAGTDYVDLTGEPEFVDRMYVRYHATAERPARGSCTRAGSTRSRTTSAPTSRSSSCPPRRADHGARLRHARAARSPAARSHSAVTALSRPGRPRPSEAARASQSRGRRARRSARRAAGRHDREIGDWALPLPTIDPQIVLRSAAALPEYGPDFRYGHYVAVRAAADCRGRDRGRRRRRCSRWPSCRRPASSC